TLYDRKSVFSVGGDLRLLSSPAILENGRWLVPPDSAPRVLGPLLGLRADWRAAARVLLLGEVTLPRIEVSRTLGTDNLRVSLEALENMTYHVALGVPAAFTYATTTGGDASSIGDNRHLPLRRRRVRHLSERHPLEGRDPRHLPQAARRAHQRARVAGVPHPRPRPGSGARRAD